MADTLRIFCRQAAFDAHKLYYVPQFEKSEQRLTDGMLLIFSPYTTRL